MNFGEQVVYDRVRNGVKFVDRLWDLGRVIHEQQMIEFGYVRQGSQLCSPRIKSVGIMMSEQDDVYWMEAEVFGEGCR